MAEPKLLQKMISITRSQKTKLEYLARTLGKSESELVREAIDAKYPNPQEMPLDLKALHEQMNPGKVRIDDEEWKRLYQGDSSAIWKKIEKNKNARDY